MLVSTHDNVERLSAEHHAVLERVQLCRGGDQGRILAFYADLFFDAHVLASVLECAVGFVVRGGA